MSGGWILWPCHGSSPSQTPVNVRHAGPATPGRWGSRDGLEARGHIQCSSLTLEQTHMFTWTQTRSLLSLELLVFLGAKHSTPALLRRCARSHTRSHMYLIWRRICVSISWAGPVFGQVLEADSYPSPSPVTARRIQRKIKQVLCEKHCCHLQCFMHIWIGSASCQSAAGRPRIGSQLCARACTSDGPFLRVQPVRRWRGQSKLLCKHSHVCLKVLLSQAASVDSRSHAFVSHDLFTSYLASVIHYRYISNMPWTSDAWP